MYPEYAAQQVVVQQPVMVPVQPGMGTTMLVVMNPMQRIRGLCITLIVFGVFSFIAEISWLVTIGSALGGLLSHGVGIWVGLFYIVTGSIGLNAVSNCSKTMVLVTIIAAALGMVFSLCLIGIPAKILSDVSYVLSWYLVYASASGYFAMFFVPEIVFGVICFFVSMAMTIHTVQASQLLYPSQQTVMMTQPMQRM